ncbi:hypothetical protein [Lapillicoccus sp.]|uniref:hypothetical protein n=1 Tax=Lapillicoccus sp. TaxID=1909287 RepID=UPI0032667672
MTTNLQRIAFVSMGLVAAGSLTGCGGGSGATPAGTSTIAVGVPSPASQQIPTPMPGVTPSSSSTAAAIAQSVTLDATGWLAGFKVTVKVASLDPRSNLITVGVTLTNTSQVDQRLGQVDQEISIDPGDGSGLVPIQLVTPNAQVVAGTTATSTLSFAAPSRASLGNAVLVLGKSANHQWLIPLRAGASGSGESPVTLTPPVRLTTPGHAYYEITSAQLLPWSCSGVPTLTAFIPSAKSTSVIAVNGTAGAGSVVAGGNTIEQLSITAPDGTTAAVITPPLRVWHTDQSTANELMCVPVPTGLPGRYRLEITDALRTSATAMITVP